MKVLIIVSFVFLLGFYIGKLYFEPNKTQTSSLDIEKRAALNKVRAKVNEKLTKDKDAKIVIKLPSYIKKDLLLAHIEPSHLDKVLWKKFLQDYGLKSIPALSGDNLLHIAIKSSNSALLEYLLSHGYDLNTTNAEGMSPMMIAAKHNDIGMIIRLMRHGCSINNTHERHGNLLKIAFTSRGNKSDIDSTVGYLLRNGLSLDGAEEYFSSIVYHGNQKYIKQVLQNVDPNYQPENSSKTILESIIASKQIDDTITEDLLAKYDVKGNDSGYSILHVAAGNDTSSDIFQKIIGRGFDVNEAVDTVLQTPLMYAAKRGYIDKVKILLDNGADPSMLDNKGRNVFDYIDKSRISEERKEEIRNLFK